MASQQNYTLKPINLAPGFQLKLSQVLSNSLVNYQIQSDCVMMIIREGAFVDLYFCNSALTRIQNYLAIGGVTSLKNISIKYNSREGQMALVYKTQSAFTFYRGKIPTEGDSRYRSTLVTSDSAVLPIDKKQQVIGISEIYYIKGIGYHCLITGSNGQVNLLQFNEAKRKLSLMKAQNGLQNRVGGIFRSLIKPLIEIREISYRNCTSFLYPYGAPQNLYSLVLVDNLLHIKYYNLSARDCGKFDNSCQQLTGWQISLAQHIGEKTPIIRSLFISNKRANRVHEIALLMVCLNGAVLDFYEVIISLTAQAIKVSSINDIFKFKSSNDTSNSNSHQIEEQILFNKDTDFVDIKEFNNKIFVVCHRQVAYRKKKHTIVTLDSLEDHKQIIIQPTHLDINEQVRVVNLEAPQSLQQSNRMDEEQQPRLLLVGQFSCFDITYQDDNLSELDNQNQNILENNKRVIPPIPSYEQPRNTHESKSQKNNRILIMNQESAKQFNNPFSKFKIEKYINRKDFTQLFNLLNLQKEKFNEQVQLSIPNLGKFEEQLLNLVLLKLFTFHDGLSCQLNNQLIKEIFNENLQNRYKQSHQSYDKFIKDLFIGNNINSLKQIFQIFLTQRYYTGLYEVCTDVIPKYLEYLETTVFKPQSQNVTNQVCSHLQSIKDYVIQNYLNLYEKLLLSLNKHYMETQNIEPYQNLLKKAKSSSNKQTILYRNFSQFEQKELFDKYLLLKSMIKEGQKQNNTTLLQIIEIYLKKSNEFGNFLVNMAIKHKNLKLFDYMLLNKMVSKENLQKFVSQYQSSEQQHNEIKMLMINYINQQMKCVQTNEDRIGINTDKNLSVLLWIPEQLIQQIYQYLIDNQPKVGIMYGLMYKKRTKVAEDIQNKLQIIEAFANPQDLLGLLWPLYKATKNLILKFNIDLARLLAKSQSTKFISAKKFKEGHKLGQIKISNKNWQQFRDRVNRYNNQEIQTILDRIVEEELITIIS